MLISLENCDCTKPYFKYTDTFFFSQNFVWHKDSVCLNFAIENLNTWIQIPKSLLSVSLKVISWCQHEFCGTEAVWNVCQMNTYTKIARNHKNSFPFAILRFAWFYHNFKAMYALCPGDSISYDDFTESRAVARIWYLWDAQQFIYIIKKICVENLHYQKICIEWIVHLVWRETLVNTICYSRAVLIFHLIKTNISFGRQIVSTSL